MFFRLFVVAMLFCCCRQAIAQPNGFSIQIDSIDQLINISQFAAATNQINTLEKVVSKNGNTIEQTLELKRLQARLHMDKENDKNAIGMLLEIFETANAHHFNNITCKTSLHLALLYEKSARWNLCREYLSIAGKLCQNNNLKKHYSTWCIRSASYYRLTGKNDSAIHYAEKAIPYAKQYGVQRDLADAYLLLGLLLPKSRYREAINYHYKAQALFVKANNFAYTVPMYANITRRYFENGEIDIALRYSDSSFIMAKKLNIGPYTTMYKLRSNIFFTRGNMDSAYYYFKAFHKSYESDVAQNEAAEIKKITAQFAIGKKEEEIKKRNLWLSFILSFAMGITIVSILIYRKNRKIKSQNNTIQSQVDALEKLLDQKEILLSELQHRVKNNLMHVISILEMQKESVLHAGIDEAITESQNRIQSMAMLHSKLNSAEHLDDIDFQLYMTELSELVLSSYQSYGTRIEVKTTSTLKSLSMNTAISLGQIMVELISNSVKHAFKNQQYGLITIAASFNEQNKKNELIYSDNGIGFDFYSSKHQGLGLEIIRGIAAQMNGELLASDPDEKGFKLTIYF